jgi:hypothetical protein
MRWIADSDGKSAGLNTQISIAMGRQTYTDIVDWRVGWGGWPERTVSFDEASGKALPPAWARKPEAAKPEPPKT